MMVGALLGKITGQSYAEETPQKGSDISAVDKDWEQLPLDILSGACLVSDPEAPTFGATISGADCVLSQYIHVYQGLEIMLSKKSVTPSIIWLYDSLSIANSSEGSYPSICFRT